MRVECPSELYSRVIVWSGAVAVWSLSVGAAMVGQPLTEHTGNKPENVVDTSLTEIYIDGGFCLCVF